MCRCHWTRVSDPDSVFLPGSGFGSDFQIPLDQDSVSAPDSGAKKECRKGSKIYLLEENLNEKAKNSNNEKATISY